MSGWLAVLLLGGAVGVDGTALAQIMISRPLVAGALTGLIFGDPAAGALVGGLLEVFHLPVLPFGAARYPEGGVAAVAATAAYLHAATAPLDPPALLLALLVALVWERVGEGSAILLRRYNGRLAVIESAAPPAAAAIEIRHLFGIALDFLRAAAITGLGAGLGLVVVRAGTAWWSGPPLLALVALSVAASTAIGSGLSVFGGWRDRRVHFLVGALLGALVLVVR